MKRNKSISSLVIVGVLAASVSTAALAGDHRDRGNGAAIVAGVLGAVVIGSLLANSQPAYVAPQPYYQPQPYQSYAVPAPTYYSPGPVRQTYYEPSQQYYESQPVARYSDRYERRQYRHRDRDGYYAR